MGRALELFMERVSVEEEVRKTLREVLNRPIKEILSYVIMSEKDATSMYNYLYQKIPMDYAKETFKKFVEMEASHDRKVMSIFNSLFPGEEPPKVPFKSWTEIFAEKDFRLNTVKDYLDILKIAMDSEILAEKVYQFLEERLEDPAHKRIMLELAQDEREHYEFIKKEYELCSKIEAEMSLKELVKELMRDKKSQ
ncbi:ferritin-like domain-containing protein [Pyrococcus yayanosii]|uniref:Rubrerythrin subfamily n=1 Tax=Pyrococcus yayanosii (strain CH1 / JCM 16557) TaxID=529709 RepID=F8AJ13_PYRYC|nr:ferritin family protein [Pyrococcus yayanosii]AEH24497.1 Rubrerythrin subfamily [Pyrococcus yayanosii CH1]